MNTTLLQTLYSALNIAQAAAEGIRKLQQAEATGEPVVIQAAQDEAEEDSNDLADRLRSLSKP